MSLVTLIAVLAPWAWRELTTIRRYSIAPQIGAGDGLDLLETRTSRIDGQTLGVEAWDLETGMQTFHLTMRRGLARATHWNPGGAITNQAEFEGGKSGPGWSAPPWRFGAHDQTRPTAPWIIDGLEFDEWFRTVDRLGLVEPESARPDGD